MFYSCAFRPIIFFFLPPPLSSFLVQSLLFGWDLLVCGVLGRPLFDICYYFSIAVLLLLLFVIYCFRSLFAVGWYGGGGVERKGKRKMGVFLEL